MTPSTPRKCATKLRYVPNSSFKKLINCNAISFRIQAESKGEEKDSHVKKLTFKSKLNLHSCIMPFAL